MACLWSFLMGYFCEQKFYILNFTFVVDTLCTYIDPPLPKVNDILWLFFLKDVKHCFHLYIYTKLGL